MQVGIFLVKHDIGSKKTFYYSFLPGKTYVKKFVYHLFSCSVHPLGVDLCTFKEVE
uniref:Uncharacterized protein n=1 Tax=Heterorhabditis bacteriophora TaxID=37862 RepID=A0A1I7X1X5_HETBA